MPQLPLPRRRFLLSGTALAGLAALRGTASRASASAPAGTPHFASHHVARLDAAPDVPLPPSQRPPFGWRVAPVAGSGQAPLVLSWPELPAAAAPVRLRFSVGLDERDEKTVSVRLARSGRSLGAIELLFVSQFQLYELPLSPKDLADVRREGVALSLDRGAQLEIFTGGEGLPPSLAPHLLEPGTASPLDEFFERMHSLACVQQFGWMEGCVLDGLLDLGERPAHRRMRAMAGRHLDLFFRDGTLVYENHLSAPSDGRIYGIEGTAPFAALARTNPRHPLLDLALEFWTRRARADGVIQDGGSLTSEGSYTVGYPLAELARARGSDELMRRALLQVRHRQERLFDGQAFWRTLSDAGKQGNRFWARGIAWQILGLARTLEAAGDRKDVADLIEGLRRLAAWSIARQRPDGLWSVFVDDPRLTPDTAGSAGIAAALAIGARHGWLDMKARAAAERTSSGLVAHLTPDGFLGGVSQSNKGGEGLQRGSYRSLYQMGMGLYAQLLAALG